MKYRAALTQEYDYQHEIFSRLLAGFPLKTNTNKYMKTFILTLGLIAPVMLLAQQHVDLRRTAFKTSPQHFANHQLKIGIERFNASLNKSVVFYLYGTVQNNSENMSFDRLGYSGLGGEAQFRRYLSPMTEKFTRLGKSFYQGIYLAGFVQGGHYSRDQRYRQYYSQGGTQVVEEYELKKNVGNWAAGFTLGIQRTLWNIVFLEAYVGGGAQFSDVITFAIPQQHYYYYPDDTGISSPDYQGILPKIGFQIGVGL